MKVWRRKIYETICLKSFRQLFVFYFNNIIHLIQSDDILMILLTLASSTLNLFLLNINYGSNYGDILACQPGAWLVKKICLICMQSQNFIKRQVTKR